jgi:hypothetical protein
VKPIHVMAGLGVTALVIAANPACKKKTAPPPSSQTAAAPTAGLAPRWTSLHLPTDSLKAVLPATNEHGYYADYAGRDEAALWAKVSGAMHTARYIPGCNVLDGRVRGFIRGEDKLAAKIDTFGDVLSLSIFDEQGKDPMLHGVCFGKYKLGPAEKIK